MATDPSRPTAAPDELLAAAKRDVEAWLEHVLPRAGQGAPRLAEALRYSVFAGGKRLRPALALTCSGVLGGSRGAVLPFAGALELLHSYSLIHDDLPAMDDDDLRRGRPTSHKVFGEALAILAGDALHTLAFETLLADTPDPLLARDLALLLARAAGHAGMVGGQVEDLAGGGQPAQAARLEHIHLGKTAALIAAACEGGARAAGATAPTRAAFAAYGRHLGLAFQIVDDVLDETGTAAQLGKTPGKDRAAHKMTYVALEGVEGALRRAEREREAALAAVRAHDPRGVLAALAQRVTSRDR